MLIGPRPAAFTRTILLNSMMMILLMSLERKPILKPILIYSTGSVRNPLVTTIRKMRVLLMINCFLLLLYCFFFFLIFVFKQNTSYEFDKALYANFHGSIGIMFLITFQVKDPVANLEKDFQAWIHYSYCGKSQFIMCRPKHHQADSLGVDESDHKKQRLE